MDFMYLVHVRLHAPRGSTLPSGAADIFASYARTGDALEHIAVHPDAPAGPTLGYFMAASSLAVAEDTAARVSRQAVAEHPGLSGFVVVASGVALIPGPV
jgi:hypothetical protein